MQIEKNKRQSDEAEVILHFHVTAKIQNQTALQLNIDQVGLFLISDFEPEQEAIILSAYCPGLLYPYVRQQIANLSLAAGFSPISLPPINFDHVYQQQQQATANSSATVLSMASVTSEQIH